MQSVCQGHRSSCVFMCVCVCHCRPTSLPRWQLAFKARHKLSLGWDPLLTKLPQMRKHRMPTSATGPSPALPSLEPCPMPTQVPVTVHHSSKSVSLGDGCLVFCTHCYYGSVHHITCGTLTPVTLAYASVLVILASFGKCSFCSLMIVEFKLYLCTTKCTNWMKSNVYKNT